MIFDLKSAFEKPVNIDFTLPPSWWKADEYDNPILGLDSGIDVHLHIRRAGERYVVEGSLHGGLILRCDRCIEAFHFDLKTEFRIFLAPYSEVKEEEIELSEDDMAVVFISGEEIELDEIIRSEIYLSIPMKILCKEDCAGLCPICGKNLNKEKCSCKKETGHPAFAKLKELLKK